METYNDLHMQLKFLSIPPYTLARFDLTTSPRRQAETVPLDHAAWAQPGLPDGLF
jgi:hypothetical protein